MSSHPRVYARTTAQRLVIAERPRVLVYGHAVQPWIEDELAGQPVFVQIARTVTELVSALVEDPPPRPQFLVADFDSITVEERGELQAIRKQGWFGCIIGLGAVPKSLRKSLQIERVLRTPYPADALRGLVARGSQATIDTGLLPKVAASDKPR